MEAKKLEGWQSVTFYSMLPTAVIAVGAIVYRQQTLIAVGLFGVGIVFTVHATLSFLIIRYWYKNGVGFANSFDFRGYFAIAQLLIGIAALVGAVKELATNYVSSGRFSKDVFNSFLIPIGFALLLITTGILMLSGTLVYENKKLKVRSEKAIPMMVQGIACLIAGLLFCGLMIFAMF